MVVKRFFISISMLFLGALLLQAKNNVIDSGQYFRPSKSEGAIIIACFLELYVICAMA